MEASIGDTEINVETDSRVEYQLRQERLRDLGRYVAPKYTLLRTSDIHTSSAQIDSGSMISFASNTTCPSNTL